MTEELFKQLKNNLYHQSLLLYHQRQEKYMKYLGFPLTQTAETKLTSTIEKVKEASNKRQYALQVFDVIKDLSDLGLDYFFVQTLRKAGIGAFKLKAVEMALSTGKRGILTVGKGIIKGMNDDQLMVVVELMEASITVRPSNTTDEPS